MKLVSKVLVLTAVLGFAGFASAAKNSATKLAKDPAAAKADKPAHGHFVKLDGKKIVFKSGHKGEEKEVTVDTDDKTTVTIDGKSATLADLKEGQNVTVASANGVATHIEVAAPKAKADKAAK